MGELNCLEEFRSAYQLKQEMLDLWPDIEDFMVSMGTSTDYEAAIVEGGST